MADRPINMRDFEVRALLDGRKTQTRRVAKVKWKDGANRDFTGWWPERVGAAHWQIIGGMGVGANIAVPYAPSDRLWVREAWSGDYDMRAIKPQDRFGPARQPIWYWADTKRDCGQWERPRSPIHMPRWASRITLTVTDVRVQRVQEISEADAISEGIWLHTLAGLSGWRDYATADRMVGRYFADPRQSYASLWNIIHGPGAWDANPWVAALTFTVRKENIDHD